ncbi:MAG: ABC transporter substrate-binding protein [Pseudomonadota bacterium]|nr:ABC transporter substrate-binding protein [Pseudomonadota bacterium]
MVVTAAGDFAAAGLVTKFAKPGGNITGFSLLLNEVSVKRVELLRQSFPKIKRATVIWNPVRPDNAIEVAQMQEAARQMGLELQSAPVRTKVELATVLEMLAVDGTQAVFNAGDTLLALESGKVVRRAAELNLPGMFTEPIFPRQGGLMSYGPDLNVQQRRGAEYVDRILKGEKAGDLPIEMPTRFELVINRKAARAKGWEIPQSVLMRADEVIDR